MSAPRARRTAPLLSVLLLATTALAQPAGDAVRFAADAEKARGHLLVSEELYGRGRAQAAALHAAHPVQELGNRLIGPLRRVDAAHADRLRDKLKEPGRGDEGFKSGLITQLVEYQDALPSSLEPPRAPLSAKQVKELTDRITASLPK